VQFVLSLPVARKAVLLLYTLEMKDETDAHTKLPLCESRDYFSCDCKVHDFLAAIASSNQNSMCGTSHSS